MTTALIGVIIIMLTKVIPTFEKMYHDMGNHALPGPTQVVIKISHAFLDRWYVFAASAKRLMS